MGAKVVSPDCRFTLPVVGASAELISSTVLEAAEAVLAVHGLSADSDSSGLATSGVAMLASDEARRAVLRAAGAAAASAAHALVGPQGGLLQLPGFGTKAVARLAAEAVKLVLGQKRR